MDYEAWAEAWVRKKPRYVIHDQFLIALFDILGILVPWILAGTCFWLIFVLKNFIFGLTVFGVWTSAFLLYAALRAHIMRQNRKRYPSNHH